VSNVSIALGGRTILRDINFSAAAGELVGIIGANGAGKTTLLRILLGLLKPGTGTVKVLDRPIRRGSRLIGYVSQRTVIDPELPLRGRDFVGFGLDGEKWGFSLPSKRRTAQVTQALRAVGALGYADAPVGKLSGGEQQRLFIAQALLSGPKILLLDEPLSNLDIASASEIVKVVDELRRSHGVTVLFVTHDINPLIKVMDRVIYLAAGRAAVGPVDQVVREEVLSKLYGYHVDVIRAGDRVVVLTP